MHGRAKVTPPDVEIAPVASWAGPVGLASLRSLIDARLDAHAAARRNCPATLNNAIRHALLAPGKRVRPLLTLLTAAEFGTDPRAVLDAACAVEMVHTASLVLDDLPCMDNASTRRGVPSTHVAFGEATALLASIALLTRAFGVIARMDTVSPAALIGLTAILSHAAGANGLAAGQERDLHDRNPLDPLDKINMINDQKTGALFTAALQMGGRCASANDALMVALAMTGGEIGRAFQAFDDVIDLTHTKDEAGKDTGKDAGKATIATVLGLDAARAQVARHVSLAHAALEPHAPANGPLRSFITTMFNKTSTALPRP